MIIGAILTAVFIGLAQEMHISEADSRYELCLQEVDRAELAVERGLAADLRAVAHVGGEEGRDLDSPHCAAEVVRLLAAE